MPARLQGKLIARCSEAVRRYVCGVKGFALFGKNAHSLLGNRSESEKVSPCRAEKCMCQALIGGMAARFL